MTDGPTVLDDAERARLDDRDDTTFYERPRFAQHVDEAFRDRLRSVYADRLAPGDELLDLMSSWVSHLPDVPLGRVVGHGMNPAELERNPRLDEWFVADLNEDPTLPQVDDTFDAVLCAVSVQYLQYPGRVFAEVDSLLRPGGVCIVSFSNRMFPTKAVRAWRRRSMDERARLVSEYLDAGGLEDLTVVREPDRRVEGQPADPFYAVVATGSTPISET